MKKRYTEEQIITAIKEHEAGTKVDDLCRQPGLSSGTFIYRAQQIRWMGRQRSQAPKRVGD